MRGRRTAGGGPGIGSRHGLPPGSTRSLRVRGPVAALVLVAGLVLGACGTPAREVATGTGSTVAAPTPSSVAPAAAPGAGAGAGLPTLPPVQTRAPDRFDANGCLRTSPTASDCTQRADQLDASAAGRAPQDWRTLSGFVGSQYTTDVSRGALVVLTDTITITTTNDAAGIGAWTALGLVRNEQARTVAGVAVEATLTDADGSVLEVVTAESPVRSLRAGEPAPFRLRAVTAGVSPGAVAHVTWRATEVGGAADPSARQLEVNTYWTRPYGDERPVHMYLHDDEGGQVPAYLLFGSARADAVIARPHVVLAWLGASGKVQAVRDVDVADPGGAPAGSLAPGAARDFLVAVDDPTDGPIVSDSAPMLWAAGR